MPNFPERGSDAAANQPHHWAMAVAISNAIAVSALIGIEALFLVLSLDWSLVGLFHLGPLVYVPFVVVSVGAVIWLTVWVFRRAWAIERRMARDGEAGI